MSDGDPGGAKALGSFYTSWVVRLAWARGWGCGCGPALGNWVGVVLDSGVASAGNPEFLTSLSLGEAEDGGSCQPDLPPVTAFEAGVWEEAFPSSQVCPLTLPACKGN